MLEQSRSVDLALTARSIAEVQLSSGAIPWGPRRHWDPWNHIEAAMGLSSAGLFDESVAAYSLLKRLQRKDGSWAAAYLDDVVFDPTLDANFCAYIAAGVHHHFLASSDPAFLEQMWPTVQRAIGRVLKMQRIDGSIAWAEDGAGNLWDGALVTSSACIYLSLGSALALAHEVGESRPEWELARIRLADAVAGGAVFESKSTYAMDWYYPALGGAVTLEDGIDRLKGRWDVFVLGERGVRCLSDRPWITAGETSELILACLRTGMTLEAATLFDWIQHLRDESDGMYWTGANHPAGDVYPYEKTTWSAGSVLLAADALTGGAATCAVFGIEGCL